jgi:AAHS family 4-hydroxybenzoate transporter-like MFS transporter
MSIESTKPQGRTVDVIEVIDSAKFFPVPFSIAVMMIIIMLTDGFDLFTMGYVGPHLIEDWGVSRSDLGPVNSASLIGMAIGSVLLGWLGDRIGRKRAYVSCLALLFIGSLLSFYANNINELAWWRLVTGFGLGGVTPLATTLISEWTSKHVRSVVVACVIVSVPLGGSIAGMVERMIVPEYGWRSMFMVGAIAPLILFALFSYLLPESPKYMAKHPEQHPRLARALNRLLGEKRFDGSENFVVAEDGKRSSNWLSTIWNSDFRRRTLLIWTAFAANSFVLYMFTNYLSVLLQSAGQSPAVGSQGLSLFSLGAAFGSIGGAFMIGWFGSRWVGTGLAFMGALATAILGGLLVVDVTSDFNILALCLLAGASVNGMQAFMYAVGAHSYPTEIRASAVGMAQTFSRLGAVLSPSVASIYFAMDPMPSASAFFMFVAVTMMLTVLSFFLIPTHIPRNKA